MTTTHAPRLHRTLPPQRGHHRVTPDSGPWPSSSSMKVSPTGSMARRVWPICSSYASVRPKVSCKRWIDGPSERTAIAMCSTRLILMASSSQLEKNSSSRRFTSAAFS